MMDRQTLTDGRMMDRQTDGCTLKVRRVKHDHIYIYIYIYIYISMHMQNFIEIRLFILKILSKNAFWT